MSELSAVVMQRRGELYGPNRCLAREDAKKKQLQDHIRQNFQKGAEIVHSNQVFQTTTAGVFKDTGNHERRRAMPRHTTRIHFGSDLQPSSSVTMSDYPGIDTPQYEQFVPEGLYDNNFVDFAPRYRAEDITGQSHYQSDFDGEKTYAERCASKAADGESGNKSQSNSKFHTATHFQLGNYLESPASESSLSFRGDGCSADHSLTENNCSKSNVFRQGDYNVASVDATDKFLSTQKKDFTYPDTSTHSGVKETDENQRATNFILGYDDSVDSSVYTKDFHGKFRGRAPIAADFPDSKVMHEFPVVGKSSTSVSRQDFIKHKLEPGRLQNFRKIEEMHKKVAVDLRCGGESGNRLTSVTALSFTAPPSAAAHVQVTAPVLNDYNHLESNRALLPDHPLLQQAGTTEARDNYIPPMENVQEYATMKKETLSDRNARMQTNKGTHFILGYNPSLNETEQMAEFTEKEADDPTLMATGRPDLPTKGYSILSHDSGESGFDSRAAGVPGDTQQILQQRNFLKNINPRDTVNLNLRKAFLEYDKNLSGAISRDDLKTVCRNTGIAIDESDLDEIIARCDRKGDGLIDYHEFSMNLSRLQPPSVALLHKDRAPISITQQDFTNPKQQQMTEKQRLAQEKDSKRFLPIETQPSRLMQWEGQKDYLLSINQIDFKEPATASL